jgi:O-antigen/teichoic acid export membrane protein
MPTFAALTSLINYSKYAFLSSVGGKVFSWADVLIIGYILTQVEVGIYEISWQVSQFFIYFTISLTTTIFPEISEMSSRGKTGKIEELLNNIIQLPLFIIIPAFFGSLVIGPDLLGTIFGEEYSAGGTVLVILLFGRIVQNYHVIFAKTLQAIDLPKLTMQSRLISIPVNITLNFILILNFGLVGAAAASVISITTNAAMNFVYLSNHINVEIPLRETAWAVVSSFVMVICLYIIRELIHFGGFGYVFLYVLTGACVYTVILITSPAVRIIVGKFINKKLV